MRKLMFATFLVGVLAWYVSAASAEPVSDRITVTVLGKGPDVVLIPGAACSSAVWDATARRLEGRYRLHIVQVAGFAGSPPRANAQGPITQPTVNAIDAYIKANKLKAPMVIGHSLGGLMGLMLAVQHPEDVSKLMIVDELPFFAVLTRRHQCCGGCAARGGHGATASLPIRRMPTREMKPIRFVLSSNRRKAARRQPPGLWRPTSQSWLA